MINSRTATLYAYVVVVLLPMWLSHAERARAQTPPAFLVEDLVTATDASVGVIPTSMTVVDDQLYFVGWHPLVGRELWTSDGTVEGTRLVADTCPGLCGIHSLVAWEDAVYFESCNDVSVCQLWRSDGTRDGTAAITRFSRRGARVRSPTVWNGALYFVAADATRGAELHRTDGTLEGTELVVDLAVGAADADIFRLAAAGDRLIFSASNAGGTWASDGTPSGTTLVRPQIPNDQFLTSQFLNAGTWTFFIETYFDLWASDGTVAGTRQVLASNRVLTLLAAHAGNVFFTQLNQAFDATELWISDGTVAGTRRIQADFPFHARPLNGVEFRGELYFSSADEVWKTDGTSAGTVRVVVFDDGISDLGVGAAGDELLVGTRSGLWRIRDGGSAELLDDSFSARGFTAFGDGAVFQAGRESSGVELGIAADGVATVLSEAVDPGSSHPTGLASREDSLVFADSLPLETVYETDGTTTRRLQTLEDQHGGFGRHNVRNVTAGGQTFVLKNDLWVVREDGLDLLFEDFREGSFEERWLLQETATAFGDRLFFLVWNFENDRIELWSSDGSRDGTRPFDELMEYVFCFICDPPEPLPTFGMVAAGNRLFPYFEGRLWSTDGSPGRASEIDLGDGCDLCDVVGPVAAVGDRLFFGTAGKFFFSNPEPRRLWASDGTASGTSVILEFDSPRPDGRPASMGELVGVGETAFFAVETSDLGDELWRSDGTAAGTFPVSDLRPGPESSNPRGLTAVGGELYFAADDGTHGRELWALDALATDVAGGSPHLVADLYPGAASSSPVELAAIDGHLFFAAVDGVSGLEPWTSDGTAAGTARLSDLQPGFLPSSPSSFRAAGENVYFAAGNEEAGFELWATPRQGGCDSCVLNGRFKITARWIEDGVATAAQPILHSDETILFWFFSRSNTELLVKMVDGRGLNDHYWLYYGALSDLEYEIQVEDLHSGAVRTYRNPRGNLCGGADIRAFREPPPAAAAPPEAVHEVSQAAEKALFCPFPGDPLSTLCLRNGRFAVEVDWMNQHAGGVAGFGRPIVDTDETGYFWFFERDKLELAVKLLDGRAINGKFWFFYGALSDVEYLITVTDRNTGAVRTYHNSPGDLCGGADIESFDP